MSTNGASVMRRPTALAAEPRQLRIEQMVQVPDIPPDAHALDVWHPLVSDAPYQHVLDLSIDVRKRPGDEMRQITEELDRFQALLDPHPS